MSINLKSLVGKLNSLSRRALEAAAGMCLSRTNYNVEIEHWLLKLLEPADSDLARIVKQYGIDASRVNRDLTRSLDKLRTGNARAPELSLEVVDTMREAWVLASLKYGSQIIRSGHVLAALLTDRNLSGRIRSSSEELAKIPTEQLEKDLPTLTSDTAEAAEAARSQPAAQGDWLAAPSVGRFQDAVARSIHLESDRAGPERKDRSGARPRRRSAADHRHAHPPPAEQSDPHRRSGRRQDGRGRRLRPANRGRRRPRRAEKRRPADARSWAARRPGRG